MHTKLGFRSRKKGVGEPRSETEERDGPCKDMAKKGSDHQTTVLGISW